MASKIQPKTEKKGRIGERERERRRNSSLLSIQHSPKELKKKKKNQKKKKLITLWASQIFVCFFFPGPPTV